MDQVFESSKPRSSKNKLKSLLHLDSNKQKTKYFPLKGGDGTETLSDFPMDLDYSPQAEMEESLVEIPKSTSLPNLNMFKSERLAMPVPDYTYGQPSPQPATAQPESSKLQNPWPIDFSSFINLMNQIADFTIVLKPLNNLAASFPPLELGIALLELFIIMLVLNLAAQITQILTLPAIWILKFGAMLF